MLVDVRKSLKGIAIGRRNRLASVARRVLEEIWRHAWGESTPLKVESLYVHVSRIRKLIESSGVRIESMIRVGYGLMPAASQDEAGG